LDPPRPREPDGRFAFALNTGGPYELRAEWGAAMAVRTFTAKTPLADIDLGRIELLRAPTLRGIVHACAGGEIRLTPLPDTSQPLRLSTAAARRVALDADGRFYAEGLASGTWLVGTSCPGVPRTAPEQLTLRDGEDAVLELPRPQPSGD